MPSNLGSLAWLCAVELVISMSHVCQRFNVFKTFFCYYLNVVLHYVLILYLLRDTATYFLKFKEIT